MDHILLWQDDQFPPAPPPSPCPDQMEFTYAYGFPAGQLTFTWPTEGEYLGETRAEPSSQSGTDNDALPVLSATSCDGDGCESAIDNDKHARAVKVTVDAETYLVDILKGDVLTPVWLTDQGQLSPALRHALNDTICDAYMLVKLSLSDHVPSRLGVLDHVERAEVPEVRQLNDGSWEVLVLKTYVPVLCRRLYEARRRFHLDLAYDGFEPRKEDVECWGLEKAKHLCAMWFETRAMEVIRGACYIASVYYRRRLDLLHQRVLR
ncbi:hypothetical protein G647_10277 [Cladophialophora carrionii CBS 160.54]|uniref:Uncharacterized protein n=1 Tax=Cladophialophora carrionii CBS 160.54 TaxID=1279043 RepID=V9DJD4_9EURO|nr:uncharacterized protein G647_10277 [Cladophialophora carrionii CBS 160.54]ETI26831.1 hypothetical protein G647_10277 [Cladophialophora carrionii CBS 160.54]